MGTMDHSELLQKNNDFGVILAMLILGIGARQRALIFGFE